MSFGVKSVSDDERGLDINVHISKHTSPETYTQGFGDDVPQPLQEYWQISNMRINMSHTKYYIVLF